MSGAYRESGAANRLQAKLEPQGERFIKDTKPARQEGEKGTLPARSNSMGKDTGMNSARLA